MGARLGNISFDCDDILAMWPSGRRYPAAAGELVRLGANVTGRHRIRGHTWIVLQDPEGNEFCLAAKSYTG